MIFDTLHLFFIYGRYIRLSMTRTEMIRRVIFVMRKVCFALVLCAICMLCFVPRTGWANEGERKSEREIEYAFDSENGVEIENERKSKKEKKPFFLSPNASWFFPSSGKVKDAFGDSWGGLGVGINPEAFGWKQNDPEGGKMQLSPYFGYFSAEKGDNDAHIIPLGIEARWALKEWDSVKTYLGLGLAGYAVKFEDRAAGIDTGWKAAGGGRVMLQADISKWLTLEASYNAISSVEGYNFGGFSIGAEISFYF